MGTKVMIEDTSRIVRIPIESFSYANQSDVLKVRLTIRAPSPSRVQLRFVAWPFSTQAARLRTPD